MGRNRNRSTFQRLKLLSQLLNKLYRNKKLNQFPKKFGAPRAENLRELGPRGCTNLRISLQLFIESAYALTQDNARVQRRDDANVAQKTREKFAKFPEIRHAPRTKNLRALGQRALRILHNVAES